MFLSNTGYLIRVERILDSGFGILDTGCKPLDAERRMHVRSPLRPPPQSTILLSGLTLLKIDKFLDFFHVADANTEDIGARGER